MQATRWRIIKRKGYWYAYKRKIGDAAMPYVIRHSQNKFDTWTEAFDWVRHDRRKPHA